MLNYVDENGQQRRGKTKLADLWNLPQGQRVVVDCNTQGQPVGNEGGLLAQFLGTIARNGGICTLSHKDWRYVQKAAKDDIIAQVKVLTKTNHCIYSFDINLSVIVRNHYEIFLENLLQYLLF